TTPPAVTVAPAATTTRPAVTVVPATTATPPAVTVAPATTAGLPITTVTPETTSVITNDSSATTASTSASLVTIASTLTTAPVTPVTTTTATTNCSLSRLYCDGCGIAPISIASTRIVNGAAASMGEYPYQVAVLSTVQNSQNRCGGAIIKERWILTAAHCFYDLSGNKATDVEVRYGSIDINGGTSVTASRFIDHPRYNRTTKVSVIVILKLGH
ncbi:transmembrane protease serine 9-like, partial [Penaeus indicus]|uniref:transmembrane protease serine 9-like n=1 Tax=Penaeus indicus TaxID=29960 RepID=UPI00300C0566